MIEEAAAGEDVELMVRDKFYSGLEVIDLIAYMNITELLESSIMNTIVSNYWEGPYDK